MLDGRVRTPPENDGCDPAEPVNCTVVVPAVEVAYVPIKDPLSPVGVRQVPPAAAKQPPESAMPFAAVDVAVVEVRLICAALMPAAKVEVELPFK